MGFPELESNESVIVQAHNIKVKSVMFEAVLTNKRMILIDGKKGLIPPQIITLAAIRTVEGGENAIRDPIITVSIISPGGQARQMIITFPREASGDRRRERDDWLRALKTQIDLVQASPNVPDTTLSTPSVLQTPAGPPPSFTDTIPAPSPKKKLEITRPRRNVIETVPSMPQPVETTTLPVGSFCSRCGNRVPPESAFCNKCGTPVAGSTAAKTVPQEITSPAPAPVQPVVPQVQVPLPPVFGLGGERKPRPLEEVIHSIEPLIEDSKPRTTGAAPLVPRHYPAPSTVKPPVITPPATPEAVPDNPMVITPQATPVAAPVNPPVITPSATPVTAPDNPPVITSPTTPVTAPDNPPVITPPATMETAPVITPDVTPVTAPEAPHTIPPETPLATILSGILSKEQTPDGSTAKTPAESTSGPAAPAPVPPSGTPVPPAALPPKKSKFVMIAGLAIVILLIIGGIVIFSNTLGGVTPEPAITPVITSTPAETIATPTTVETPVPTKIPVVILTTQAPPTIIVPKTGVWIRITYPNKFDGTYGMPGNQIAVGEKNTGDQFFSVSTINGPVEASIQKLDGSSDMLVIEVYKDGELMKRETTISPKGVIDLQADFKPVITPEPKKTIIPETTTETTPAVTAVLNSTVNATETV